MKLMIERWIWKQEQYTDEDTEKEKDKNLKKKNTQENMELYYWEFENWKNNWKNRKE